MKKKQYKKLMVVVIILITLIIIGYIFLRGMEVEYKVIRGSYKQGNIIINDYEQYTQNNRDWKERIEADKYDQTFFEKKSLALVNQTIGPSSHYLLEKVNVSAIGNTLNVVLTIKNKRGRITTRDMQYYLVIAEIDKKVKNINVDRKDIE